VPLRIITAGTIEPDKSPGFILLRSGESGSTIRLTANLPEVLIEVYKGSTYNGQDSDPEEQETGKDVYLAMFPDKALAKRVLETFLHAADLCRTKEPF
jgi:hypothetical protein